MIKDAKKTIYGLFLTLLKKLFGKDTAKKFDAKLRFGRKLDLKNPKTLADKVVYLENHCCNDLTSRCTDKWEVREYVREKGLENILVPVYGSVWDSADQLDFNDFPDKFVLKATHGCKMNYLCADKKKLDQSACKREINRWLKSTYGAYSCEWHYTQIPHRYYCEQYLGSSAEMIDYKIHCLNGKPEFILVCSERVSNINKGMKVTLDLFDTKWEAIDGLCASGAEVPGKGKIKKPSRLDEMLDIAKKLSSDFDFVRVDLYEIQGKVYFGELTFTPANGVFPYFTQSFLEKMGKKFSVKQEMS